MIDTPLIDVLVVGAGPVGLTLAIDLARRGIDCRIIDKAATYAIGSRARGVSPRTQEIFEDLGALESLRTYAAPPLPMRFFDADNKLVREIDPTASAAASPLRSAPYYPLMIGQQHLEAVLREVLASYDLHVEMGCALISFTHHPDYVVASVQHGSETEDIRARFLVGCDGGHSTVRKCAGIAFLGETWEDDYTFFGNVSVSGLEPSCWYSWSDPTRGSLHLQPMLRDDNWFFGAAVKPDQQGELPSPSLEALQRLFDERVGLPGVRFSNPTWLSIWRPNIRMVERYRSERVFLAGDAAHVHSAAGGQGMNTGIQDAYNLGWKLALALDGGPEDLLDTYQAERLPVAQGVLASTSARHRAFRQVDPGGKSTGAEALNNLLSGKDRFGDITQLSITYRGSPLACDLDDTTGIRAGDRAPDAPCIYADSGDQVRLFDLFRGTHFTLLGFSDQPVPQLPDKYLRYLRVYAVLHGGNTSDTDQHTLIDCDGHAHNAYGIAGDALILVRPDGYIGLTGANTDQEQIIDYLGTVTER
jgi:2-polyprenyl-6-methoxyphenol hydroxylase-like FAD-dependent oxidoreductase